MYDLMPSITSLSFYQISHFLEGFMGWPVRHWKASENSGLFCMPALTLTLLGECVSVCICLIANPDVDFEHQSLA